MKRLQLFDAPLQGVNLIEAGAGTGKTFTIAGLYLRLLLEAGLTVAQILVVTYTRAATAELRERIRAGLLQLRRALEQDGGDSDSDSFYSKLLAACDDRDLARQRLSLALLEFDRAAIFTIHGFCQRVLADSAFESAMPFETELLPDQYELLQEVVDDFWRLQVQDLSPGLVDFLLASKVSPESLLELAAKAQAKPGINLRGEIFPADLEALERDWGEKYRAVQRLWGAQATTIADLLRQATGLNGNKYRSGSIENWLRQLELFLGDPPGPWFDSFDKFTRSTLDASVKKGGSAPVHDFFDACERLLPARQALQEGYRKARVALLGQLVRYSSGELRERKARSGVQSYDDLLLNLEQALASDKGGQLAAAVADSYRAALIDEFQDTDPLQYTIFQQIFAADGRPLFLVGDPKQAIYSFRGADVFAYLRAHRDADACYTLDLNWRSEPQLLAGVNLLFEQSHASFFFPEIGYPPAQPADRKRPQLVEEGGLREPLRVCLLSGPMNKAEASQQAVGSTAAEIARLLHLGRRGRALIGDRPLVSGDIAVLVRTHAQGLAIREALLALGIHSVQRSQENVFHAHEALELERVLRAVAEPGREPLVRAAISTDMIGFDGARLAADEAVMEDVLEAFQGYHRCWRNQGFVAMFTQLMTRQGVAVRLLEYRDGERRLTNLLHLGELLHQQDRSARPAMEGLLKWLAQRRQSERLQDETHQLRLESDQELVQIVTIHKSKGLEYPVVFHPFAWEAGLRKVPDGAAYTFHDPELEYATVLELGSPRWQGDLFRAGQEELAESLRLLYVALTRAEQRCYLHWGNVSGAEYSALAWLLHPPADTLAADAIGQMAKAFKGLGDSGLLHRLEQLRQAAPGALGIEFCADNPSLPVSEPPQVADPAVSQLAARNFQRSLRRNHRVTSFSAINAGQGGDVELPDYDGQPGESMPPPRGDLPLDIFHFPRGARAGSCLHAIFERLDFARYSAGELRVLVLEQLAAHAIDRRWSGVVEHMVRQVLDSELEPDSGIRLRGVENERKLVEFGFYYPLAAISGPRLAQTIKLDSGFSDPLLRQAIERLSFAEVSGFMRGFIDLVFEAQGRFYLVDYKSNWLGDRQPAYNQERLTAIMGRDGYYLQYLLYTLALHRYLGQRIADYDYERHFGAVFYLFLRGMDAGAGPGAGIYRSRPSKALIQTLDQVIGDTGPER